MSFGPAISTSRFTRAPRRLAAGAACFEETVIAVISEFGPHAKNSNAKGRGADHYPSAFTNFLARPDRSAVDASSARRTRTAPRRTNRPVETAAR